MPKAAAIIEVARAFLKLGVISFGGPVAHLGYFRNEFVATRRWVDEAEFADLVALCQFLPGPASSQVVFGLGMRRAGILGAFAASLCFTLPSAALLILFAYGVSSLGDLRSAGWLHGLKLAAVAVVAQAVWRMGRSLCPDRARLTLALLGAVVVLAAPVALAQVGVIAGCAACGWLIYRTRINRRPESAIRIARQHWWAAATLIVFGALLIALPMIAAGAHLKLLAVFDSFYRAGSLVFGGGHVVLPLLRAEVVPPGWVTDNIFLAGYGAAQAVPGPLFTFSAYLGTMIFPGPHAWLGGLLCLFAIFLPAWMLIGGALPFWHLLRTKSATQAALRGANAGVVGVLLAALYNPVWVQAVAGPRDVATVIVAFALLEIWRLPAWLIVLLSAGAGQGLL